MKSHKVIKIIKIYEKMYKEGRIKPDGIAYTRMQQLKLRRLLRSKQ